MAFASSSTRRERSLKRLVVIEKENPRSSAISPMMLPRTVPAMPLPGSARLLCLVRPKRNASSVAVQASTRIRATTTQMGKA
jgi:hypothetical protein